MAAGNAVMDVLGNQGFRWRTRSWPILSWPQHLRQSMTGKIQELRGAGFLRGIKLEDEFLAGELCMHVNYIF